MKYVVYGEVKISVWTEVEANNQTEAKEIASRRMTGELAANAFTDSSDEVWVADSLDGEPVPTEVEEA